MRHLADINVWLALAFGEHPHSKKAWNWLDSQEAGSCLFCRITQQGFLRLATNPKAFSTPLTHKQAWEAYDQFLSDERIEYIEEPEGIEHHWRAFTHKAKHSPKIWNDAYLAAFAKIANLKLLTFDKGFREYSGLTFKQL